MYCAVCRNHIFKHGLIPSASENNMHDNNTNESACNNNNIKYFTFININNKSTTYSSSASKTINSTNNES